MKRSDITKTVVITSVVLLVGAAVAFAHGGWDQDGYGHMRGYGGQMMGPAGGGHMMDGSGYGPHMRGYGAREALSDEQMTKLDDARDKFFKDTQELRGKIEEKEVTLRNEVIKDNPDTGKAAKLQKELSQLRSDFDQKALQHRLEMRKLAPETFQGRGDGRGYGRGYDGYCNR
jgi:zinc resistance-associated protein